MTNIDKLATEYLKMGSSKSVSDYLRPMHKDLEGEFKSQLTLLSKLGYPSTDFKFYWTGKLNFSVTFSIFKHDIEIDLWIYDYGYSGEYQMRISNTDYKKGDELTDTTVSGIVRKIIMIDLVPYNKILARRTP